jgi:hypothetical protein
MRRFPVLISVCVCLAVLCVAGCNHKADEVMIDPAYRPYSENAAAFLKALETATIAIYPTIVRTLEETSYSPDSQKQIVSLLDQEKITTAVTKTSTIDPGELKVGSQWEMFLHDMHAIADELKGRASDTQYSLVMEILLPPGNQSVFGIHCYVLDRQGRNAFSFLLNSHHRLFIEANLNARDSTPASRAILITRATQVGVNALIQQVRVAEKQQASVQEGYSISTKKLAAFDSEVARIMVIARVEERLQPVFLHSFEHSMISAFQANGVDAMFKPASTEPGSPMDYAGETASFKPDATMRMTIKPLYRERKDGYQAIVGTDFEVSLINMATGDVAWSATGKVDYIQLFGPRYTAHQGIRKEFAWHTTAAIVRALMADVFGRKSAPIYTVTEDRQIHGQRVD